MKQKKFNKLCSVCGYDINEENAKYLNTKFLSKEQIEDYEMSCSGSICCACHFGIEIDSGKFMDY